MEEAKFSILERYGENFTEKEYITNPAIGRDNQIKELMLEFKQLIQDFTFLTGRI